MVPVSSRVLILTSMLTVGSQAPALQNSDTRVRVSGASLGFQLNSKLLSHPLHTTALHLPSHTLSWPVSCLPSTEHSPDTPAVSCCLQYLNPCIIEADRTHCSLCMWPWVAKSDQEVFEVPRNKKLPSDFSQAVGVYMWEGWGGGELLSRHWQDQGHGSITGGG